MNCLKCGKETEEGQVFCASCLADMEKHPVKSGITVHIPDHEKESYRKRSVRKRVVTQEELLALLKKRIRRMRTAIITLSVILALSLGFMGKLLYDALSDHLTGLNYTIETTAPCETTEAP